MLQFSNQIESYQRLIRLTEIRQRVISHNISNVNTPGFKAIDIEMPAVEALQTGSSGTADLEKIALTEREGLSARADGNNVDIDVEVGESNKNALLQQTYLLLLGSQLNNLRRAMQT